MTPKSLEAIKFLFEATKPVTRKAFNEHFAPNGEEVLQSILVSHVDEVKGKLVLNQAGSAVAKDTFGE